MERAAIILARLYWTLSAVVTLSQMAAGSTVSSLHWIADCATLVTCVLSWLSYPWAWMTAGVTGFLSLVYKVYVIVIIWLAFAGVNGVGEPTYTVSYGPIHIKGIIAELLWWGSPLFGFVVTSMFAYFGAGRSDAKNHA
jgi:hypothetical protein